MTVRSGGTEPGFYSAASHGKMGRENLIRDQRKCLHIGTLIYIGLDFRCTLALRLRDSV